MIFLKGRLGAPASFGLLRQTTFLLACLLFVARVSASQADEDLTFEEEGLSRTRREIEVAPVEAPVQDTLTSDDDDGLRVRRQVWWNYDDEDSEGSTDEGSGMLQRIYRCNIHVLRNWQNAYNDKNSQTFQELATGIERALSIEIRDVPGDKVVTCSNIKRSNSGMLLAVVDINYEGWTDQTESLRRSIRSALEIQFLGAIPVNGQYFKFDEPSQLPSTASPGGLGCRGDDQIVCDGVQICKVQLCDGVEDCPGGDDEKTCGCGDGEFKCDKIRCLSLEAKCDGSADCMDRTDEEGCGTTPASRCDPGQFSCDEGTTCYDSNEKCNGFPYCYDESDEEGCPTPSYCTSEQFQCNNGQCIEKFRVCDFMDDCPGGEDEQNCPCRADQFQCISGQCISGDQRCDKVRDCEDGSDEDVGCPCRPDQWTCDDGMCIRAEMRCDNRYDCPDYSDERDCPTSPTCRSTEWTCSDGTCIPDYARCNGRYDCPDDTDEEGCTPSPPIGCNPSSQWTCRDGSCVDIKQRCDGVSQCIDRTDEENCPQTPECLESEWRCRDGTCISFDARCDRVYHCLDLSDEEDCETVCAPGEWACLDGVCLDASFRCDGILHCSDRSDEENCPPLYPCTPYEWECQDRSCIPIESYCDGRYDCPDFSDETDCPIPACGPNEWQCQDSSCIQRESYCDGRYDCPDFTDEIDCPPSECRPGEWRCSDGTCLPQEYRCDNSPQCIDRSDEENCPGCGPYEWQCLDGSCIQIESYCDGRYDCRDFSDETECTPACGANEWQCRDTSCIYQDQYCDGRFDCPDYSDEENCQPDCRPDEWKCLDGTCIPREYRCDQTYHCIDRSDEENCPPACRPDEWRCRDGSCIAGQARCDDLYDCRDYSDEEDCPETPRNCRLDEWRCSDGTCIPLEYRCDRERIPHCSDRSDEENCPECREGEWQCKDRSCIPENQRCDGYYDCGDYSDEQDCPPIPPPTCRSGEWRCTNGDCVPEGYRCNGSPDCFDQSDEENCPPQGCGFDQYTCNDRSCIALSGRCDGTPQCYDSSDEYDCPPERCASDEWQCVDGACIRQSQRCDNVYDCSDESDEEECPSSDCRPDQFRCEDNRCIDISQRCNGREECYNGEDERGCPCRVNEFKCQSDGFCIDLRSRCDGRNDCSDGSDEDCPSCPPGEWRCNSGQCIPEYYRCDGRQDCSDNSDENPNDCGPPRPETPQCTSDQFRCQSGSCINKGFRCDGISDCPDGSDEIEIECTPVSPIKCTSGQFACNSGECVGLDKKCNTFSDCIDGSDETGCPGAAGGQCNADEFKCTDGACIDMDWKCDNVPDCGDASDELFCNNTCGVSEYQCGDGKCVPEYKRCDGSYDCADQSDERDSCCRSDEYQCSNGDCIPINSRCNGIVDCLDRSDENPDVCGKFCTNNQFTCGSGECVSNYVVCDGRFDCIDRSDENRETCPGRPAVGPVTITCTSSQFRCGDGTCIEDYQRCNGLSDCFDSSDERDCPPSNYCQTYEFQCRSGQCISRAAVCDDRRDCLDGSDETDCPTTPASTTPRPVTPQSALYFICQDGSYIADDKRCDNRRDCPDASDEVGCGSQLDLKTYPNNQTIQQTREVVFQCRDEGSIRAAVTWSREGRPLPPGATDIRGRLTIPNIQVEHSGSYYCEAQDVPPSTPNRRKYVTLTVVPYAAPPPPPTPIVCNKDQATCMNGQCIAKEKICDGNYDCDDSTDEMRCNPLGCEPNEFQCDNKRCILKTWMCDFDNDCGDESDEQNCVTSPPGSACQYNEFTCRSGILQCIPKSFHCDTESDCQDGSDEEGCIKPTIVEPPPRNLMVEYRDTFVITCKAFGVPVPTVIWRLNWGHVPDKCTMTSEEGFGTLTCPNAEPTDQGAYSCEAINNGGSVFATPDCILTVKTGPGVCNPPEFNVAATSPQDCERCFCFGVTTTCFSTDRYISQLPPPRSDSYQLIGMNQDQVRGIYVIRDTQYPLSAQYVQAYSPQSTKLAVDRTKLSGPSDLIIYFSLPDSHKGQQLTSYGGFLRYKIQYSGGRGVRPMIGPDVVIRGNNLTLMHVHDGVFRPDEVNQVDVLFTPRYWYKSVVGRGRIAQPEGPASREDIMMVLENMELLLIRALYNDGLFVNSTLSEVQLDTAVISNTEQGRAVLVEKCTCPEGYVGISCQNCAPGYKRVRDGRWLGTCVREAKCGPLEYGDPSRNIPCRPCPCPLTNPRNQFASSCRLINGNPVCACNTGYEGPNCERCSPGYEGDPTIFGDYCKPVIRDECDPVGSYSTSVDPITGRCQCKEFVTGLKCDKCKQNAFFLDGRNSHGCIRCFCMGITNECSSSNYYRTQESVSFTNDRQDFQLADKHGATISTISNGIFIDSGRQEIVFREFSRVGTDVYYWKLPKRFTGDKVTSYGGNLTYTLRYEPVPGQKSPNAEPAVKIFGNDITLMHYSKVQLSPSRDETVVVPFYEQHWKRQDGQEANREHFLMVLADLEYILIKATYTTNTVEVGLKQVVLDYAIEQNTGQDKAEAVEECDCPQGYKGLSCEDCNTGYTRGMSGLHLGTCERCQCNGHSEYCDPEFGICENCRDNTAGQFCDECARGYERNSINECVRVSGQCTCDLRGSVSTQCFGNRCPCKQNVRGDNCDSCRQGFFHLSENNRDGCLECWCSGVSSQCFSSNYYRLQIPMQLLTDHGFTLSNRLRSDVIRDGFNIDVQNNEISFSDFSNLRDGETYYWSLPQMFIGNKLTSYGGNLTIMQRYQARAGGNRYADPDVIIRSSGGRELIWMKSQALQPNNIETYSIPLYEEYFTMNQRPTSRVEFLNALSSIEAILVRATLSDRMSSTFLRNVILDTAVSTQTGQARAWEVEQCQCPIEYGGLSCEQCKPGYYRDTSTSRCNRCPCNGHEESCALRPGGGVRCNCLAGYYGDYCEGSGPAPSPDRPDGPRATVSVTVTQPSILITSIGSTVQFRCSARSLNDQRRVPVTWSKYNGALPYGRATDDRQGLLEISQVRLSDNGVYVCTASDGFSIYTQNATLTVSEENDRPGSGVPSVRIEEPREVVELRRGQTLEVRCSAVGNPRPQVIWSYGPNRGRLPFNVFSQNGVLTFRNAQSDVKGEYFCTASNAQGTDYARIIINIVPEDSRPDPSPLPLIIVQIAREAVAAQAGETVRVSCTAGSPGVMTISWSRRSGPLPSQAVVASGELQIVNARPVDSGLYVCRITDERTGQFEEATTRITITEAVYRSIPNVSIQPDRQTINQGTSAELRCIVSGDPPPVITWTKVNEEFGAGVRIEGNVLRITNAVVSDRGMYVCSAENAGGTAQSAAIVEVERREPPVIEIYPEVKQTIVVGSSALFQCHLTAGIPNPDIVWGRTDQRPLTPNTETLNGGVLRFNQVKGDEEGSYTCTATNDAGSVKAVAILEIQAVPVITIRPGPSPYRARVGERVRLECSAQGDPAPTVSWQKLQVNFPANIPSQSVTPTVAVYEIQSVSLNDEGTYQCSARNDAGVSEERLQLIVEESDSRIPSPGRPERPGPSPQQESVYSVTRGGNFELVCSSSEREDVRIEFKRADGIPMPRGYRVQDGVLYLTNVDETAAGEYACIGADRVTGSILFTIYSVIQVLAPPRITLEPARQVVRPGDQARIYCSATGSQPITINWSKDVGYMPPSVIINGGEMMFRGIKTTDAGRYICEAINSGGNTRAVAEVVVNERPLLTAIQQDVVMYVGQTAELRCEASGINPNEVTWERVGGTLPPGALARGNLLRLPFIQPDDSGRYLCKARTGSGNTTSDLITLTVQRNRAVDIRIEASKRLVRIGDSVVLTCKVGGDPAAAVSWTRVDKPLLPNTLVGGAQLRISSVQADNGGLYRCTATTQRGVFEDTYPLAIQGILSSENVNFNGVNTRSVKTRSVAFGTGVVMECNVNIPPPVSYTWSKQGGELPLNALVQDSVLDIPEVHIKDAGLYVCTGSNNERSVDLPTLLVVTGVIPRFTGSSHITLATLPRAYLAFDLDISFKPESGDGLILYNSQKEGGEDGDRDGDFISFGLSGGYAEFRFDIGSGPAVIRSRAPLELNQWHTVRLSRNRKEGTMIVDDGSPVTGRSVGRFLGLDLVKPMYLGAVPDFGKIRKDTGFSTGFRGCISRLVIGKTVTVDLMRDAKVKVGTRACETCAGNPCQNSGVCQEAYTEMGHKCICPAGYTGGLCETTGEACYAGVCGTGRCVNKPGGFECFCPFGKMGQRCEQDITIVEPAFGDEAYIAYPTPRALRRFSVDLSFKPQTLDDGVLMYCAQKESGEGDFASLAIKDRRLEFRFNTGSGTAVLQSDPILQNEWIDVRANRTDRLGSMSINGGVMQNTQSPGTNRGLNLVTPLFIGGIDRSRIEISPEVEVNNGFQGCVKQIKLMDQEIRLADSLVDSANVGQCGGASASMCHQESCRNRGQCVDNPALPHGYTCVCMEGYSGRDCEIEPGVCSIIQPCRNGGACIGSGDVYSCRCPLGFAGQHCEHVLQVISSASFSGDSWVEFDRSMLPHEGVETQKVTFEFSTVKPDGLLFWLGQDRETSGRGQDYVSVAIKDGFVEFSYQLGTGPGSVRSPNRINDGERHTLIVKRTGRQGSIELDGLVHEYGQSPGILHMLNTKGNIYIGGVPDLALMTAGSHTVGFQGCIHQLTIGDEKIINYMNLAMSGINVTKCPRNRGGYRGGRGKGRRRG